MERDHRVQPHGPHEGQHNRTLDGGLEGQLGEAQRPGLWGERCLGIDPVEEAQAGRTGMDIVHSWGRYGRGVAPRKLRRTWRRHRVQLGGLSLHALWWWATGFGDRCLRSD